jgi:hypothetical protein
MGVMITILKRVRDPKSIKRKECQIPCFTNLYVVQDKSAFKYFQVEKLKNGDSN